MRNRRSGVGRSFEQNPGKLLSPALFHSNFEKFRGTSGPEEYSLNAVMLFLYMQIIGEVVYRL